MADMNTVCLIGRLTADAEYKTLSSGKGLCEFSIANNRGYGEYAKVHFINVKMFGNGATGVHKYLVKGKRVGITGELTIESWEDRDTGKKRTKPVVVTFDVQLMDGGEDVRDDEPKHGRTGGGHSYTGGGLGDDKDFNERYAQTKPKKGAAVSRDEGQGDIPF